MTIASKTGNQVHRSLPTIFAVGSSLVTIPASAIELGEMTVQSRLGQPLRASIAYALAPNERLSDYCVSLRPGASVSGLPGIGAATVKVSNGVFMLAGKTPVREPMISAHIVVNCPNAANISREYLAFVDPLAPAYDKPVVTQQATPVAEPVPVAAAAIQRPVASVRTKVADKDISSSTQYLVKTGDTLSEIASRIDDRPIGLWPAVNAIFAANPDAFINNDPNKLKAGSRLTIPDFGASNSVESNVVSTVVSNTVAAPTESAAAQAVTSIQEPAAGSASAYEAAVSAPVSEPSALPELGSQPVMLGESETYEPEAGDAVEPPVLQQSETVIIDADLEGPVSTSETPNVTTAIITTRDSSASGSASNTWLLWLAGSGVALIIGLLMFGRRFRGNSVPAPTAPHADQEYGHRRSDSESSETENKEVPAVNYNLPDDSPTEENLVLDADLVMGTGLTAGSSADFTQDIGYDTATELDLELPFEPVTPVNTATDILPPLRVDESSILKNEVLPEEDDYDMSVVIDATKMPLPDDITEHDLKAVELATDDNSVVTEQYTINEEAGFQVLEQDYEDELTATQALNEEIARAALELTTEAGQASDDDATAEMPMATVTELDMTSQMPAQNDENADPGETSLNETLTAKEAGDDDTTEMPIGAGKAS